MLRWPALAFFLLATRPARAHSPIEGVGAFYNGAFHPALVLAHLLLVLALGIWLGHQGRRHARSGMLFFGVGLMLGLLATVPGWLPDVTAILPLLAAACCLGIILMRPVPVWLMAGLAWVAGLCVGLDSPAEGSGTSERWLMLAGTWLGGCVLLLFAAVLPLVMGQPWARIGWRILAAWGAASSLLAWLMVLALR